MVQQQKQLFFSFHSFIAYVCSTAYKDGFIHLHLSLDNTNTWQIRRAELFPSLQKNNGVSRSFVLADRLLLVAIGVELLSRKYSI